MSSSRPTELAQLRRDLATISGILALSMLMVGADSRDDVVRLAAGAISTLPDGALLGVTEDQDDLDDVSVVYVPLRTNRERFGYLAVRTSATAASSRFVLEAIAHQVAVAFSALDQRDRLREQAIRLADNEALYRNLADRSPDGIFLLSCSPACHVDYVSPSLLHIVGRQFEPDQVDELLAVIDSAGRSRLRSAFHAGAFRIDVGEERFFSEVVRPSGDQVLIETQVVQIRNGVQGIVRDMTENGRLQRELTERATRDPLTGLSNRRLLDEVLEISLARATRSGGPVTVAMIDLDDFKPINDRHGHPAGDEVLRQTAGRLREAVRANDIVARLGGDEFVVVLDGARIDNQEVLDRVRAVIAQPIAVGPSVFVTCTASVGAVDSAEVGSDPASLLAAADAAMYADKERRRDQAWRRGQHHFQHQLTS